MRAIRVDVNGTSGPILPSRVTRTRAITVDSEKPRGDAASIWSTARCLSVNDMRPAPMTGLERPGREASPLRPAVATGTLVS
jgi:hypothetical protein